MGIRIRIRVDVVVWFGTGYRCRIRWDVAVEVVHNRVRVHIGVCVRGIRSSSNQHSR